MEEKILAIITPLFVHLGIPPEDITKEKTELGTVFSLTTDNDDLIGVRGETLLSLNYIAKKIAEKAGITEPFSVDVNGYQKRKIEEIRSKAALLAERAKSFQTDIEMEPMSSYERMVAHAALASNPEIKTESAGIGRERRVVIKYLK